jgi:hypothetical protein
VRRFRNPGTRGAPEVVLDRDGAPLILPIDCTFVEFRELVDAVPGRYRLDPLDERRKVVPGVPAAYVSLNESVRNASSASSFGEDRDVVVRELVRAHTEMMKTMTERFSGWMDSAARMMTVVDNAGLLKRPAVSIEAEPEIDEDEEEEDEDQEGEGDATLAQLIQQVMPMIQMYLASKMGGATATPSPSSPPSAPASAPPSPVSSAPRNANDGETAAPQLPNANPTAAQMDHIKVIQAKLTPVEASMAMGAAMRMAPEARAEWIAALCARSVDEAVVFIRELLPAHVRGQDVRPATAAAPPSPAAPTPPRGSTSAPSANAPTPTDPATRKEVLP